MLIIVEIKNHSITLDKVHQELEAGWTQSLYTVDVHAVLLD